VNHRRSQALVGLMAFIALVSLVACADTRDQSLCDQAADLESSVDVLQELDRETVTADEVESAVETVVVEAQQLRAAADGTIESAAATLQESLADLRRSLSELSAEDLETARPLIEDAWTDVTTAYAQLQESFDVECNPA